jgi:hypothetical protein
VNESVIPTGDLQSVAGIPFDFRVPTAIGARVDNMNQQLQFVNGYDHYWVTNKVSLGLTVHATVYEPETGRALEVSSTEPGIAVLQPQLSQWHGNGKRWTDLRLQGRIYGGVPAFSGLTESSKFPFYPSQAWKNLSQQNCLSILELATDCIP